MVNKTENKIDRIAVCFSKNKELHKKIYIYDVHI